MVRGPADQPSSTPDWWTATAWGSAVVMGSAAMAWLTLRDTAPAPFTTFARGDIWQPGWLVLGLLMAFAVFKAARASWVSSPLLICMIVGQTWYIVSTGLDGLAAAGLRSSYDQLWYLLVAVQFVLCTVAAIVGGAQCWRRRRWTRQMRALFPDLARQGREEDAPPAWREGFYSHG